MIAENIQKILDEIESIKQKNNIDYPVQLMAVSKTYPAEAILEAVNAGQVLYGENRVLEAKEKFTGPVLSGKNTCLHIIGHLQRNKAKQAVECASMIESIDKLDTLETVQKQCDAQGKKIDYLVEVNTSGEPQKYGIMPDEVASFIKEAGTDRFPSCNLRGLMTVGPLTSDEEEIRRAFRTLKKLFTQTADFLGKDDFDTLSMGMSSDYSLAIEEGSNLVRIGSKIFGKRNYT